MRLRELVLLLLSLIIFNGMDLEANPPLTRLIYTVFVYIPFAIDILRIL